MPELENPQHEEFCQFLVYDTGHNASEAARLAGYSEHSAGSQGHRLLKNDEIQARVAELRAEKMAALREKWKSQHMTGDEAQAINAKLARSNILDFLEFGPDGITLKHSSELPREMGELIKAVKQSHDKFGGLNLHVELHDKDKPIDRVHRVEGLYNDKLAVTTLDIAGELAKARRRGGIDDGEVDSSSGGAGDGVREGEGVGAAGDDAGVRTQPAAGGAGGDARDANNSGKEPGHE